MALSSQTETSDGTLVLLDVSIEYFNRSEITVLFDGVPTVTGWSWVGATDKKIAFSPAVPNGVVVKLQRQTGATEARHSFAGGAAFIPQVLDENFTQIVRVAQEMIEGTFPLSQLLSDLNMNGYRVTDLAPATDPAEAATYGQLLTEIADVYADSQTGASLQIIAERSTVATLVGKSIDLGSNSLTGTVAQFNAGLSDGDFATLAGTEVLTNKTLNLTGNTLVGTTAQFNAALSDNDFATLAGTETLTNKSVNLGSNTLAGTLAQFNIALSDADFASLAGAETLTNKTINLTSNTLAGTVAQFNAALSDGDFATLAGTETLTNKTLTNPAFSGTTANMGTVTTIDINGGTVDGAVIGGASAAAGSFTTLSASGQLTVADGTAGAPAVSNTGDENTGLFFPAADALGLSLAGTERVRFDSGGNEFLTGTGAGIWLNAPATFTHGMYTTGGDLAFRSAGANNALRISDGKSVALQGATPQVGAGVSFPATQVASSDANTLDDYEEGSFTPVISGSTVAGAGTYTVQFGNYTKIGTRVFFNLMVGISAHTGTGNILLSGLPFTPRNVSNNNHAVTLRVNGLSLTAGNYPQAWVSPGVASITLEQMPTGGGVSPSSIPMDTSFSLMVSGHYDV